MKSYLRVVASRLPIQISAITSVILFAAVYMILLSVLYWTIGLSMYSILNSSYLFISFSCFVTCIYYCIPWCSCESCGMSKDHCSGHFGHIELVSPVYNPLMFLFLGKILNRTCFSCHYFRASRDEVNIYWFLLHCFCACHRIYCSHRLVSWLWFKVKRRASQLELILKGNISKAKSLGEIKLNETIDSVDDDDDDSQWSGAEQLGESWTSLQFSEAMSVIYEFLAKDYKKCLNCGCISPKITKPTFGRFNVVKYFNLQSLLSASYF